MISIIGSGGGYSVFDCQTPVGSVAVHRNPFHSRNVYLDLELTRYDPDVSAQLFALLRRELGSPLQVMLYSSDRMHRFLTAGGFQRRRRCYEIEAASADLCVPATECVTLWDAAMGSREYDRCCGLLYDYYRETHWSVSPLTASAEDFCAGLPDTVIFHEEGGKIAHFAFVQEDGDCCEIAYVGGTDPAGFKDFAQSLATRLFRKYSLISAECDDTDPCATALRALFNLPDIVPYDTYILH